MTTTERTPAELFDHVTAMITFCYSSIKTPRGARQYTEAIASIIVGEDPAPGLVDEIATGIRSLAAEAVMCGHDFDPGAAAAWAIDRARS